MNVASVNSKWRTSEDDKMISALGKHMVCINVWPNLHRYYHSVMLTCLWVSSAFLLFLVVNT